MELTYREKGRILYTSKTKALSEYKLSAFVFYGKYNIFRSYI